MDRVNLSLKNIYKMLINNDYPVYSDSVIPEKMRKGQTLIRFWQGMVIEEFRTGIAGSIIWKNDGKRNRYLSTLCNRSGDSRLYRDYARELENVCSADTMLKQIGKFSDFLSVREYRYEILLRRIQEMVRLWEQEDRLIPDEVRKLVIQVCARDYLTPGGASARLFQSAYLLTILTLYAAAGEYMTEPVLLPVLSGDLSLGRLWELREAAPSEGSGILYMTARCGILQDNLLPRHRFFGREEALFDVRELAAAQKKCLITGIGGIGKTELLRQVLGICELERLADKIAVVPYQGSLADSFVQACRGTSRMETDVEFQSILTMIRRNGEAGERILILIDDLSKGPDRDPDLLSLESLPCGILVTSRRSSLEGFEVYRLEAPSITTSTLIFRDNYGRGMTRDDREMLQKMLKDQDLCHPFTLNLMARAAGSHGWTVEQLAKHLETDGKEVTWVENHQILRTDRIFNRLYSLLQVPDEGRRIAELFTMLPSGPYSETFLSDTFPEIMGSAPKEKLMELAEGGWLESHSDGYAMHPLIAECLRRKILTEDRQSTLLAALRRRLPPLNSLGNANLPSAETARIARMELFAADRLTGSISGELMLDLLNSLSLLSLTKAEQGERFDQLTGWRRRCRQWSDLIHITYCIVAAGWDMLAPEEAEAVYSAQKGRLTVPRGLFVDFCLAAGTTLIYRSRDRLAWDLLSEGLSGDASPEQKATAYYRLCAHCHVLGKPEEAMAWCEKGADYVRRHPECGTLAKINILHMHFSLCTQYRQREKAAALLQELEPLFEGVDRPDLRSEHLDAVGLYEMTFGDPEKALSCMQEANELYEECFGRDRNYYQQFNMMGNIYSRLNRFKDAAEAYGRALAYAGEKNDRRMLQSASNNLSVALMKDGKPRDALVHLETAVSVGRQIGGLMFGEALRNSATAYGMLGDEEKELAYYEEAWPLLLEAYGWDHPRAEAAWKRIEELKNKK